MSKESPKVTVLIATYNRPEYLKEAVQSVVRQRFADWELLVMNDGGVDVAEIVNAFGDPRIRYFSDPVNRGLTVRLNFGLNEGRGKYVAYLGDDDLWYPNHLEVLAKALDENPGLGAAYSDLYGVQFIRDDRTAKRYPLHKFIQVSRDFNRDFMFHFNHTLHVSLMHRRDLGLRVGGYDESVTVLIDWDMTRKLCFYTDFKYVREITGEYYMPLFKSDRISNLERRDPERYRHNLRKIRADLPPEPWPKVERITVIHVVNRWTETVSHFFTQMVDALCHPVRYLLVNNEPGRGEEECRRILGAAGDLKNVSILSPPRMLEQLQAYRYGAEKARGEYVFLVSGRLDTSLQYRLTSGRYYLKEKGMEGVKWDVPQEMEDPYNVLMKRTVFLKKTDPGKGSLEADVRVVPKEPPESLLCDFWLQLAKRHFDEARWTEAYQFIRKADAIKSGGTGDQFLADLYSKICFELKKFGEAEEKCADLVRRGYGADNWVRLGRIHQAQGRYGEAIGDYQKGLDGIGLGEEDLLSPVFPLPIKCDYDSYTAFIGTAECYYETGNLVEASKYFRRAAKLKGFCHRPFLGFGKIFLKSGQLGRAEEALLAALGKDENDAEVHRALAEVFEEKREWEKAFQHQRKAIAIDPSRTTDAANLFRIGSTLGRWNETAEGLEQFMGRHPDALMAIEHLSAVYINLGDIGKATEWLEKGLAIETGHPGFTTLLAGIQAGAAAPANGGHP